MTQIFVGSAHTVIQKVLSFIDSDDRAGGTGQAGQAKTGPLFLHVMFGIDRYTVMVVKD